MDKKQLIDTLKAQHKNLQEDLNIATLNEASDVVQALNKFKTDLVSHLRLENETFYVDLLKIMSGKGQNTENTEKFILEMKDIEKVVLGFLDKYNSPESLTGNKETFSVELQGIIKALNLRIESEEEGVYETYLIL